MEKRKTTSQDDEKGWGEEVREGELKERGR